MRMREICNIVKEMLSWKLIIHMLSMFIMLRSSAIGTGIQGFFSSANKSFQALIWHIFYRGLSKMCESAVYGFHRLLMCKCLRLSNDVMCSFHPFWLSSVSVQYQTRRKKSIGVRHRKGCNPLISESETPIIGTLHYIDPSSPEIQILMESSKPSYVTCRTLLSNRIMQFSVQYDVNLMQRKGRYWVTVTWINNYLKFFATILLQVFICTELSMLVISVCHYDL